MCCGITVLIRTPGHSDSISSISSSILFFGGHPKVALTLVNCSLYLTISWLIKFDYLSFSGDQHVTKDLKWNISHDGMTFVFAWFSRSYNRVYFSCPIYRL